MKKIMVAAAIVCAVAFAQEAKAFAVNWSSAGSFYTIEGDSVDGNWYYVNADTVAYFLFESDYSQSQLVSDFRSEGGINMTKFGANETGTILGDGTIGNVTGSDTSLTGAQYGYIALVDDGNLFISDSILRTIDQQDKTDYSFTESETGDIWANWGDAATYQGAGWYQAEAVPEPTTGLLMLLGMAGLALRRRRA